MSEEAASKQGLKVCVEGVCRSVTKVCVNAGPQGVCRRRVSKCVEGVCVEASKVCVEVSKVCVEVSKVCVEAGLEVCAAVPFVHHASSCVPSHVVVVVVVVVWAASRCSMRRRRAWCRRVSRAPSSARRRRAAPPGPRRRRSPTTVDRAPTADGPPTDTIARDRDRDRDRDHDHDHDHDRPRRPTIPPQTRAQPLGAFMGFAVAGVEPDEMGIGPVKARCEMRWLTTTLLSRRCRATRIASPPHHSAWRHRRDDGGRGARIASPHDAQSRNRAHNAQSRNRAHDARSRNRAHDAPKSESRRVAAHKDRATPSATRESSSPTRVCLLFAVAAGPAGNTRRARSRRTGGAEAARAPRAHGRRHRSVGAQRGAIVKRDVVYQDWAA